MNLLFDSLHMIASLAFLFSLIWSSFSSAFSFSDKLREFFQRHKIILAIYLLLVIIGALDFLTFLFAHYIFV